MEFQVIFTPSAEIDLSYFKVSEKRIYRWDQALFENRC